MSCNAYAARRALADRQSELRARIEQSPSPSVEHDEWTTAAPLENPWDDCSARGRVAHAKRCRARVKRAELAATHINRIAQRPECLGRVQHAVYVRRQTVRDDDRALRRKHVALVANRQAAHCSLATGDR